MRTTLDIDEELLDKIVKLTGEKSRSKAVTIALTAYKRRRAIEGILALAGKIEFVDDIDEILERQRQTEINDLERFRW